MGNYLVRLNFNDGVNDYDFPLVQSVSDPKEGIKATVIPGTRGDGSIVIPGGKRSQEIVVNGILFDEDGYVDLDTKIIEMKSKVTTDVATLTLKYFDGTWKTSWSYTVRRIDEITFSESLRTIDQEYTARFLIIGY